MLALGIGSYGRDSAVALLDSTSIIEALEEEKLSRSTGTGGIPRRAIDRCLEQANASFSDLSIVGIARLPKAAWFREAAFRLSLTFSHPGAADWTRAIGRNARELTQFRQLRRYIGEAIPILQLEHHLCHAASAFHTSDLHRALLLTPHQSPALLSPLIPTAHQPDIPPPHPLPF